jgi:glutaredoxin
MGAKVSLYGKADCCLCDEAKAALDRARARVPFELEIVDIAADPELLARHGEEIPVVFIDGRKAFKYRVDEDDLLARLARRAS